MNRIFHARIAVGQFLFLALISGLAIYMLWDKYVLPAARFHALADSCHREADSYYLYGDSGREAEIVFRPLLAQQGDSAEGCHFRGACLFHADRTVCSNALRTGEVWSG